MPNSDCQRGVAYQLEKPLPDQSDRGFDSSCELTKQSILTAFAMSLSTLDREAASTPATTGGVRVVELEASLVDTVEIVNYGSLHERSELAVHDD